MEPISLGILAALAAGAGGEVGRQAWIALSRLVHRPSRRRQDEGIESGEPPGAEQLAALEQAPDDQECAQALSEALASRATLDPEFAAELQELTERIQRTVLPDVSGVRNSVHGVVHGNVIQGRDFGDVTFTS